MKAKTVKEVLTAMLWLYNNKLEWCKGASYRDKNGKKIQLEYNEDGIGCVANKQLHSVCLSGCLSLVEAEHSTKEESRTLIGNLTNCGVIGWNDDYATNKKSVTNLLTKLIKAMP